MPSLDIKDYILGLLFVTILGMWWSYSSEIDSLSEDLRDAKKEYEESIVSLGISKANEATLRASIYTMNTEIEKYEIDIETKKKELEEWKAKPKYDKYKILYKKLKDYNLTKENCDETANVINAVGSIDFNDLQRMQ